MSTCEVLTLEVPMTINIKDVLITCRNFMKTNNKCKEKYGKLSPKHSINNDLYLALYRQFIQYFNEPNRVIYIFDSAKIASGIKLYKSEDNPATIARAKITEQFNDVMLSTPCNPSNHILMIVSMSI